MLESLVNKASGLKTCNFIKKKIPTHVFSYEYCDVFQNSFFYRTPPAAASVKTYLETCQTLMMKLFSVNGLAVDHLSANPTKWSNTLKRRQIAVELFKCV